MRLLSVLLGNVFLKVLGFDHGIVTKLDKDVGRLDVCS